MKLSKHIQKQNQPKKSGLKNVLDAQNIKIEYENKQKWKKQQHRSETFMYWTLSALLPFSFILFSSIHIGAPNSLWKAFKNVSATRKTINNLHKPSFVFVSVPKRLPKIKKQKWSVRSEQRWQYQVQWNSSK